MRSSTCANSELLRTVAPRPSLSRSLTLLLLCATAVHAAELSDDVAIKAALDTVIAKRPGIAGVVAVLDEKGVRVISTGEVTGDTRFEIGSVTKALCGLLLAEMVERKEVKLDDPVQKYLPASMHVPTRDGKAITLLDLATNTSGLPRLPDNLAPKDPMNPYADYGAAQLGEFLAHAKLTRAIGGTYEYSNLGFGLLGYALGRRDGGGFEAALTKRVLQPLGMSQTSTSPQGLVQGHDSSGKAVPAWDFDALAGAGAMRSNAKDLLKLLSVAAGVTKAGLAKAIATAAKPLRPGPAPMESTLGWFSAPRSGHTVVEKDGMTAGTATWVGFDADQHTAVVVWVNAAIPMNSLGLRVLSGSLIAAPRTAVTLPAESLGAYVGVYELTPQVRLTVRRQGEGLSVQLTGQGALELKASAPDEFFLTVVDAQLSFKRTGTKVSAVVLHQNGFDQTASRVADEPEASAASGEPKEVQLSAAQLEAYPGTYQLAPTFSIVITREGTQLFAQATGQAKLPIFAEAVDQFFYRAVPAKLRFERAGTAITGMSLLQNGQTVPGKRLP